MTVMTKTSVSSPQDSLVPENTHHELVHGRPQEWLPSFIHHVDTRERPLPVNAAVERLRDLIDSRSNLRMWASAMFEEVPNKIPYNKRGPRARSHVRGYSHMIDLLNVAATEVTPAWTMFTPAFGLSLVGLPFQAILGWPMGTPSGHAFFLNEDVNARLKDVLESWRNNVLATSKSLAVITTDTSGWLSKEAIAAFEQMANIDSRHQYTFEELYECDAHRDPVHWGFKSWDDFFTRRFRNMDKIRPVGFSDKPEWVVNACESKPVAIKRRAKQHDKFWLKGTNYSVTDMLNHHEWAARFVGGTVYQAVIDSTAYHRWHAPVSGQVVFAKVVGGTYFSERSTNGLGSEPIVPPDFDHVFLSHTATRALVFIQADDPVGLLCFVAVGMADVSTCEIASKFATAWPRAVAKGEELGTFRYGGSSHCILFRKGLKLAFTEHAAPENHTNMAIRSPLAFAYM